MAGARRSAAVLAGGILALTAACGGEPEPPGPSPSGSAAAGLADPQDGRLLRVLGDGRASLLPEDAADAGGSPVSAPMGLLAATGGDLLGWQGGLGGSPGLFGVSPDGSAGAVTASGGTAPSAGYALATGEVDGTLLVVHRGKDLQSVDPATGSVLGTVALPSGAQPWAAGVLGALGGEGEATLQYGDRWYSVSLADPASPELTPREAPVPGALASAPTADGAVVVTGREILTLGTDGAVADRAAYDLGERYAGTTVTSLAALPGGGAALSLAIPPDGGAGAVVAVSADGRVTPLASGTQRSEGPDCQDEDRATDDAHLALPVSLAVWEDRLVVADATCNSLLQLPLP